MGESSRFVLSFQEKKGHRSTIVHEKLYEGFDRSKLELVEVKDVITRWPSVNMKEVKGTEEGIEASINNYYADTR